MPRTALRALFVAYVAATALHVGWVMAHEPFAFDAWNVSYDTHAEPISLGRMVRYLAFEYVHSNPRLGQWFAYLSYKLEWVGPIITPLGYLALAAAVTVLGLGRWPTGRHRAPGGAITDVRTPDRDLALAALAIGFLWFAIPHIGMLIFSRGYSTNYLLGAAIQLWFLVPLRLRPTGDASRRAVIAYGVAGVLAGMCNEHTGPTLLLFLVAYAAWRRRTTGAWPRLAIAGAIGALPGYIYIFVAPGQSARYDSLAQKVTLLGRLVQRGIVNNLEIFSGWILGAAPVLCLLVIVMIVTRDDAPSAARRAAFRLLGLVLCAGSLITITVFVSPKLGPRFYFHSCALVLACFLGIADTTLTTPRRLAPFIALAVAASAYAVGRTVPLYGRLHVAAAERVQTLLAATPGSVATLDAYEQTDLSWWYLGEDFKDPRKQEMITEYFHLRGLILRFSDPDVPLGLSDVQLVPRYHVTPATCLDQHGGLDLGTVRGLDIQRVHQASLLAIERLRDRLAAASPPGRLDQLDVTVDFLGTPPALPRPTLLVARWRPEGFEAPTAIIERKGVTAKRTLRLAGELAKSDAEFFMYRVGGEARRLGTARDALEYVPWSHGTYWALACHADECFVIATARVL
ncbi:MAG TPA: DUF6056 family protein [Kofleriaceae bacterium]|nr:DUF6056 family protein [Kofleriaceae bacterium]